VCPDAKVFVAGQQQIQTRAPLRAKATMSVTMTASTPFFLVSFVYVAQADRNIGQFCNSDMLPGSPD